MGIRNLYNFIEQTYPDIYNTVHMKELNGKTCVLDGMQQIYQQLMRMRQNGMEVFLPNGKNVSHIYAIFSLLDYYLKHDIVPIFVFDGLQIEEKKKTIEKRKLVNDAKQSGMHILQKQCEDFIQENIDMGVSVEEANNILTTMPFYKKYMYLYSNTIQIKHYYAVDWINILKHMGIPVIQPPVGEADPICVFIANNNSNIYGIMSNDSDMLVYGEGKTKLMRKIEHRNLFNVIETNKLLQKISATHNVNFTNENFVEFATLLGTDYGDFKLKCGKLSADELLKCYIMSGMNAKFFLRYYDFDRFDEIKKKYTTNNWCEFSKYLDDDKWKTPNFAEVKKYVKELNVCENSYIENVVNKLQTYYMKKMYLEQNLEKIKLQL